MPSNKISRRAQSSTCIDETWRRAVMISPCHKAPALLIHWLDLVDDAVGLGECLGKEGQNHCLWIALLDDVGLSWYGLIEVGDVTPYLDAEVVRRDLGTWSFCSAFQGDGFCFDRWVGLPVDWAGFGHRGRHGNTTFLEDAVTHRTFCASVWAVIVKSARHGNLEGLCCIDIHLSEKLVVRSSSCQPWTQTILIVHCLRKQAITGAVDYLTAVFKKALVCESWIPLKVHAVNRTCAESSTVCSTIAVLSQDGVGGWALLVLLPTKMRVPFVMGGSWATGLCDSCIAVIVFLEIAWAFLFVHVPVLMVWLWVAQLKSCIRICCIAPHRSKTIRISAFVVATIRRNSIMTVRCLMTPILASFSTTSDGLASSISTAISRYGFVTRFWMTCLYLIVRATKLPAQTIKRKSNCLTVGVSVTVIKACGFSLSPWFCIFRTCHVYAYMLLVPWSFRRCNTSLAARACMLSVVNRPAQVRIHSLTVIKALLRIPSTKDFSVMARDLFSIVLIKGDGLAMEEKRQQYLEKNHLLIIFNIQLNFLKVIYYKTLKISIYEKQFEKKLKI